MGRRWTAITSAVATLAATAATVVVGSSPAAAATVPPGFRDDLVAVVSAPTALAFTPDGRMLVASQRGGLYVVQGATLLPTPALDLAPRLCTDDERGLLGVAVDPAFTANHVVFVYFTENQAGVCRNKVSRYVLGDNNLVAPASEVVLIDRIHSIAGNHNGGDLQFGKDGLLYVSVGDGGCNYAIPSQCAGANTAARDSNVLVGKILRVTRDGAIPAANPFQGAGTARCNVTGSTSPGTVCQEIFATGLRNPYRLAFDPNAAGTVFNINDVGQSNWEEIDLGAAGADYGWNVREGHCAGGSTTNCGPPPAGMTNPVFDYDRSGGCGAITGGAFVPQGVWPAGFGGKYLFADLLCGKIFRLDPAAGGAFTRSEFATTALPVHLGFGPYESTQALYYTAYANGGQVRRISATIVPGANALDADTATLEGGQGQWRPWFSTAVAPSVAQAHAGTRSLRVDVAAAHGWGVTQQNWPGFPAAPGSQVISFWAISPGRAGLNANMSVRWRDAAGNTLRTDTATIAELGPTWRQGAAAVTAPQGATRVGVDITGTGAGAGDVVYLDDITVGDATLPPPAPPGPTANFLDVDTATIEGPAGHWAPWFSSGISASTTQPHAGARSLKVDITALYGWGITLDTYPGFPVTPGPKTIGFWGRAGAGAGLGATMTVHWRNATGAELGTDILLLSLGTDWRQAGATVTAPAGTTHVGLDITHPTGGPGNVVYLDDITVGDVIPLVNALDADTSTIEGGVGQWAPWFSTTVASSTAQAHGGSRSLLVDVTAPYGWGVTLRNWPGFAATPGPKSLGFWARAGTGTGLAATMQVSWHAPSGAVLQTDVLTLGGLDGTWRLASAQVTAPAGTSSVTVDFLNAIGTTGNSLYLDDITVSGPPGP